MMLLAGEYPLSIQEERFRQYLSTFPGLPRNITSKEESILATVAFFDDLGYVSRYGMSRRALMSFILHVQRAYKETPYHNWMHAFTSAHFVYLLILDLDLNKLIGESRSLALLIAALCHDMGHPGTTSNFQILAHSEIASKFEPPSLLEKYHASLTKRLFEIHENDIFQDFDPMARKEILQNVDTIIMATDLYSNWENVRNLNDLPEKTFNATDDTHVLLALKVFATAFDLSDQTKKFRDVLLSSYLLTKEFYAQGLRELRMQGTTEKWMNPNIANVIDDQKNFTQEVAIPLFGLLSRIFPSSNGLKLCAMKTKENLGRWQSLSTAYKMKGNKTSHKGVPLLVLKDETLIKIADELYLHHVNASSSSPKI